MEDLSDRRPPITTDLVLTMLTLELAREQNGAAWCRDRVVGRQRRMLGRPPPVFPPRDVDGAAVAVDAVDVAKDGARVLLAEMCAACPHKHCKMRTW